jgi:uncharacterized RDD family membrane protein YckC
METIPPPMNTQPASANDGNRILAYFIDAIVASALLLVPFIGVIAFIAYWLIRDGLPFLDGQSVGKKAMGLRAVTENGEPLTNRWDIVLLRNITIVFTPLVIVELIVLFTNDKRQRLGDQLAKTRVITVR